MSDDPLTRDLEMAENCINGHPGLEEAPVPCNCIGPRYGQPHCPCVMEGRRNYYRVPGTPAGGEADGR